MPASDEFWKQDVNGQVVVRFGPKVLYCFAAEEHGMRNLAMVALIKPVSG
jgi:hypothetical protein